MISIKDVNLSFGERKILDTVNLEIRESSITAITGKSGSGKTTLLGIMSGLLSPDSGTVSFKDQNILKWSDFRRSRFRNKQIGFVFQFFNLLPDITAYKNIIYPAIINPFSRDVSAHADYLIDYLELKNIIHQYPATLSGGERQRVAIARAIINRPKLILADEPTGNLDTVIAEEIIRLFREIRDQYGMALVIVTHEKRIVEIADHHYHLEDGVLRKVEKAPAEEKGVVVRKSPARKKARTSR